MINRQEIEQVVYMIMTEKLGYDKDLLISEYFHKPLTWEPLYMSAIELTYLLLEVEKSYNIRIPEQCMRNYEFSTMSQIFGIVTSELCDNCY